MRLYTGERLEGYGPERYDYGGSNLGNLAEQPPSAVLELGTAWAAVASGGVLRVAEDAIGDEHRIALDAALSEQRAERSNPLSTLSPWTTGIALPAGPCARFLGAAIITPSCSRPCMRPAGNSKANSITSMRGNSPGTNAMS